MAVTLDEMERRLAEIYRRADAEIEAAVNAYFDRLIESDGLVEYAVYTKTAE